MIGVIHYITFFLSQYVMLLTCVSHVINRSISTCNVVVCIYDDVTFTIMLSDRYLENSFLFLRVKPCRCLFP